MVGSKLTSPKDGKVFWCILIFLVCFDFVTKYFIRLSKPDFMFLPFLRITYIENTGVAFGMFKDNNLAFATLGILAAAAIVYYIYSKEFRLLQKSKSYTYYIMGLGLVASGALGNAIDRIISGFVTDFIYFSPFPAFNVADSCITVGGIIILYLAIFGNQKAKISKR